MPETKPNLLDFSKFTFRASSVGKIMGELKPSYAEQYQNVCDEIASLKAMNDNAKSTTTDTYINRAAKIEKLAERKKELEPKKNNTTPILPQTAISYLKEIYTSERFGIRKDIYSKYFEKGLAKEDEAIDLLGELHDLPYMKCIEPRKNDGFTEGECDVKYVGDGIKRIIDIKNSWNAFTFQAQVGEEIDDIYDWQGVVYLSLYDCSEFILVRALMNMPQGLIDDECKRMLYEYGKDMEYSKEYEEACAEFKKQCTFDHIPLRERFYEIPILRDSARYEEVKARVIICREWLNNYAKEEYLRCYGELPYGMALPVSVVQFVELREVEPSTEVQEQLDLKVHDMVEDCKANEAEQESLNKVNEAYEKLIESVYDVISKSSSVENLTAFFESVKKNEEIEITLDIRNAFANREKELSELEMMVDSVDTSSTNEETVAFMKTEDTFIVTAIIEESVNQDSEIVKSCIVKISQCKSEVEVRELYKTMIPEYNKYPEVKTALTEKRDSFKVAPVAATPVAATPVAAPPKPKPAPKPTPTPPPPPKPTPAAPSRSQEETDLIAQIKESALKCTTPEQIKELAKKHQDFVIKCEELLTFMTEIGVKLSKG